MQSAFLSQLFKPSPWCWERLKEREGDDRGWDGWMASLAQWIWVGWWTCRPGILQSMGLQRVGHDRVAELNWTEGSFQSHPVPPGTLSYSQSSKLGMLPHASAFPACKPLLLIPIMNPCASLCPVLHGMSSCCRPSSNHTVTSPPDAGNDFFLFAPLVLPSPGPRKEHVKAKCSFLSSWTPQW